MDELPDREGERGAIWRVLVDLSAGRGLGWVAIAVTVALLTWATT